MNKPDALQLAEAMSFAFPGNLGIDKAAAELRRLHAENKVLHERHHDGNVILTQMLAQRDALLEALRALVRNEGLDAYVYLDKGIGTETAAGQRWLNARAAVAAVEENPHT